MRRSPRALCQIFSGNSAGGPAAPRTPIYKDLILIQLAILVFLTDQFSKFLVRELLAADIDEQRTGPLALVRAAVRYPASVLSAAGVLPVQRDADAVRLFPDDAFDLSPGSFAELHPDLRVPGLEWGAAKAYVHRRRHAGGTAG